MEHARIAQDELPANATESPEHYRMMTPAIPLRRFAEPG